MLQRHSEDIVGIARVKNLLAGSLADAKHVYNLKYIFETLYIIHSYVKKVIYTFNGVFVLVDHIAGALAHGTWTLQTH